MLTYIVAFLIATAVAAIATPLVAAFARKYNLFDLPTEARKIHKTATPRLGGVAVVAAFFAPLLGLEIYHNDISRLLYADGQLLVSLLGGGLVIVLLGVFDDIRGASASVKLTVQSIVAVSMWLSGFKIQLLSTPLGAIVHLDEILSLGLTVLWIVGVVNALNLIDGLDGLASGVALFACCVLFGVSFLDNAVLLSLLMASLAGALVGFLFFNFNPAKIFLGDSGSMFLGFILASASIWTQRKSATTAALLIPIIALGVPILDTTLSFVRRVGRGQNPFRADREHLHHRLLALGLSHRRAVMTLYTASAIFGLAALGMLSNDTTQRVIALAGALFVVFMIVRKVGIIRGPVIQRSAEQIRDDVRAAARSIRAAQSNESAWRALSAVLPDLLCEEIRLTLVPVQVEGSASHTEVFEWHRAAPKPRHRSLIAASSRKQDEAVVRLVLAESEACFGELAVALQRPAVHSPPEVRLSLEILRDALIDLQLAALSKASAKANDLQLRVLTPGGRRGTQSEEGERSVQSRGAV